MSDENVNKIIEAMKQEAADLPKQVQVEFYEAVRYHIDKLIEKEVFEK